MSEDADADADADEMGVEEEEMGLYTRLSTCGRPRYLLFLGIPY
jgi:hypothetical protein